MITKNEKVVSRTEALPPQINPNTITEYRYRMHILKYKYRNMNFKNEEVVTRTEASYQSKSN